MKMEAPKKQNTEEDDVRVVEKKSRKRKKRLYKEILQQMEFYFSDANLNKDRFLHRLMCETHDGRVDLREFLKFKKIRALTDDIGEISQAISSSEILELIENNTFVVRKTAVQIKEDVDACTLYVEGLPPHADHDWCRKIFIPFGKITYISLPRFKTNRKPKGFAFMEFDTVSEASLALKYFNSADASSVPQIPTKEPVKDESRSSKAIPVVKSERDEPLVEPSRKRQKMEETATDSSSENPAPETKEVPQKKQRKRKKKSKEKDEVETLHLRVMPKVEWKRLRNLYLSLQRANMAAVKKSLGMVSNSEVELRQKSPAYVVEEVMPSSKLPEFIVGVIIRFETSEPIENAKLFRAEFKDSTGVLYIDLKDGQNVGHIRCDKPDNARNLLNKMKEKCSTAWILQGSDEDNYWRKIEMDRELKLNGKQKSKPMRGKDKVYAKVVQLSQKSNLHIRFDD